MNSPMDGEEGTTKYENEIRERREKGSQATNNITVK
jgi:hypothetical protein